MSTPRPKGTRRCAGRSAAARCAGAKAGRPRMSSSPAAALALKAVARPGDTIAIESPTYFGLLHVLEALGLRALELPTDAQDGVDLAALAHALERKSMAACLFASSFNNPLGCTMPEARKLELLQLLAKHGVPLIEDDIYGDIYFGGERPKPFGALDPAADKPMNKNRIRGANAGRAGDLSRSPYPSRARSVDPAVVHREICRSIAAPSRKRSRPAIASVG